jgi:ABC-2 type transport system permease protein
MKQFKTILNFELKSYFKNKVFVGITVALVLLIAAAMFFPNIMAFFKSDDGAEPEQRPVMLIASKSEAQAEAMREAFAAAFSDYDVRAAQSADEARQEISQGEAECAFVLTSPTSYTYYVENLGLYDEKTAVADEILKNAYRVEAMIESGIAPEQAGSILSEQVTHEIESLGKDQMQNYFYTYVMVFALYMVILLYGQMVATNVASEKSSRAMEVLITSAKPTAMMFGKVIASCLAGFIQLLCIFGTALVCFRINQAQWADNPIVCSIFNMPPELLGYMLVFFLLGFFIYAFLYGAVGSTASKLEDTNTSVMPITMLFIIAFLVVMFSMSSGNLDNIWMKLCSYIPLTSPIAMFARIAMSTVPPYEIVISIAILIGSVVGIGVLAAKIYRVGVLLYGTPPKLGSILKSIWKA